MPTLDLNLALDLTVRLAAAGQTLSALELLFIRSHFGRQGVFAFEIISPFLDRRLSLLRMTDRFLFILLGIQVAAAAGLIFTGPFSIAGRILLITLFLSTTVIRWRRHIGGDGAEQMTTIIFAAALLAVLPWAGENRIIAAVAFIAAQVSLSYLTAGIAKLISGTWRDGSALPAILSTYNHGHPWAARMMSKYGYFALFAAWAVIIFECSFPVVIFAPSWLAMPVLLCGFAFHAGCAVLMGLNNFLWSFPATYPCVIAVVAYWKAAI
jgi:hypothetical protein